MFLPQHVFCDLFSFPIGVGPDSLATLILVLDDLASTPAC